MHTLSISDITLREASKASGTALSFKESLEIAKAIDRLRPYAIELPPLKGSKADTLLVKSIAAAVQHSRLVLPAGTLTEEAVREAVQTVSVSAHPCIVIPAPVSTVQMEYQCHKKPAAMLSLIASLIAAARHGCAEVEFSAEDATRAEPDFLCRAIETAITSGATVVTLCDTAGVMMPDEFKGFLESLRSRIPSLANVALGIQCSDALHLAPACAISGSLAGASIIKAAVPETGLLRLSDFMEIIRTRGMDLGLSADLSVTKLTHIEKQIDWILHARRDAASPYAGGSQRQADPALRLSADSTLHEIIGAVARLGYDLSEDDNAKVYDAFRLIAAKKDVGERELEAIVASAALQAPPAYTVESYVINSGNVITATAHVKMLRDEKLIQGFGLGDGPIDAAFLAIEQAIGHHYELDDFQIQAVTEGREAMGSALVKLRSGGRLYAGKGISTDIIGASIRAYINALNKIVYEGTRA